MPKGGNLKISDFCTPQITDRKLILKMKPKFFVFFSWWWHTMGKRHAVPLHKIVVAYCFCAIEPSSLLWSLVPDQATKKNNSSGKYCYSIIQFRMLGWITVLKGMIFFLTELFARLIANAYKKKLIFQIFTKLPSFAN